MVKYSIKNYKIMFDASEPSGGGDAEMLGFNKGKIEELKGAVDSAFAKLKDQTNLLESMESTVQSCWNGPDAEAYLDSVFAKAEQLVQSCGEAYARINTLIDSAGASWNDFQTTNSITV